MFPLHNAYIWGVMYKTRISEEKEFWGPKHGIHQKKKKKKPY